MRASVPQTLAPFQPMPFEALPERPRLPHVYEATEPLTVQVPSILGDMPVHVRRYGRGDPLLLVHGLMTSSYSWRYAFEPLGDHFTCYAPDLPGNGHTPGPLATRWTAETLAEWLNDVQRALGIVGCPVIGNSMGGYLCMRWAQNHPKAMSRLVNLHSPGVPELRLYALQAALAVPGARALLRWMIRRDPRRWAHRNVHYHDESLKSREEADAYGAPLDSHEGAEALIKYLQETMHPGPMRAWHRSMRHTPQPFPVPLLLLYATRDPMVPPRFGEVFAERFPNATLRWLEDASHFAHVDALDRFLPPVLEFLKSDRHRDQAILGP